MGLSNEGIENRLIFIVTVRLLALAQLTSDLG